MGTIKVLDYGFETRGRTMIPAGKTGLGDCSGGDSVSTICSQDVGSTLINPGVIGLDFDGDGTNEAELQLAQTLTQESVEITGANVLSARAFARVLGPQCQQL